MWSQVFARNAFRPVRYGGADVLVHTVSDGDVIGPVQHSQDIDFIGGPILPLINENNVPEVLSWITVY